LPDLATLRTWLAEAEEAQHRLLTGRRVSTGGVGQWSVSYALAQKAGGDTLGAMEAYVAKLKAQIAALEGKGGRRLITVQL
jgi:hypothetical protein